MKTYVDKRHGIAYTFNKQLETITAVSNDGYESIELVSKSLYERLASQIGEPIARQLLKGSKRLGAPKPHCLICKDTGSAYGGPCVC